jgi:hypothetical protein
MYELGGNQKAGAQNCDETYAHSFMH